MFHDDVFDLLEQYVTCDKLFLVGDLNVHFDCKSDASASQMNKLLHSLDLQQIVSCPTHRLGHTLDVLITNDPLSVLDLSVVDKALSDHFCINFRLSLAHPGPMKKTVTSRSLRKIDPTTFKADIVHALSTDTVSSIDTETYNHKLREVLDKHAPLVSRRVSDRPSAPWMNDTIIQARQERRRSERQWRRSGLTVHRQIYVHHKNRVNTMIRHAKQNYISDRIENARTSRDLFHLTSTLVGSANSVSLPHTSSPDDLASSFSQFFSNKIEKIRNDLDQAPSDSVSSLTPTFTGAFLDSFLPVTSDQVKDIITHMPKKSCQLDPIPYSLMSQCLDELLPAITNIVNVSLASGTVPLPFKNALVTPLLKKSTLDAQQLKNYRPVSNLPFLSKVLERIVLRQLMQHLEIHNLLEPFQSAYRKSHSTETALLRVVNDLLQASDRGEVSILTLLDLSAAFDTIDHEILLNRLQDVFGCTGVVLSWFRSYLSDRTQSVVVSGAQSAPSLLKYGVPQGSVLGPILFTMYTQQLSLVIKPFLLSYHFFADDTQLHKSAQPNSISSLVKDMSVCVENISDWMHANKLQMNGEKTECLCVGSKKKLEQVTTTSLSFANTTIAFSETVRDLGVHLDSHLNMDSHIDHLCKTLYFFLRRLGKIRQYLSVSAANKLAVSFILSRLDYCNSLLIGLPDSKLNRLQRIQNRAAHIVLRRPRRESSVPLLRALHWLPVKARIEYKVACQCFHCHTSSTAPPYLSSLLRPYNPTRSLRSQNSALLTVPRYSLNSFGKRAFSVSGPTVWNSLPETLRVKNTLPTFKRHLKTHLFQKYLSD